MHDASEPRTYNDDELNEKAHRVAYIGLEILDEQLSKKKNGQAYAPELIEATAQAVVAACGCMKEEETA